jgi:hypothetical protein
MVDETLERCISSQKKNQQSEQDGIPESKSVYSHIIQGIGDKCMTVIDAAFVHTPLAHPTAGINPAFPQVCE